MLPRPQAPAPLSAFVALGSNEGDRAGHLRAAVAGLGAEPGVRVVAVSPVYAAEAHVRPGAAPQPDFLNAVVYLHTTLAPEALLAATQRLERAAGRVGGERWAPRPLDLDLLLYGERVLVLGDLLVPHPRLATRRFVLQPLADLAPDARVPRPDGGFDRVAVLLARCPDRARLARWDGDLSEPA